MTEGKIKLAEWLASLKAEISLAESLAKLSEIEAAKSGEAKPVVLRLVDIVVEATIATEESDTAGGKVQAFVVTGDLSATSKSSSTQRVQFTLKPVSDVNLGTTRRDADD